MGNTIQKIKLPLMRAAAVCCCACFAAAPLPRRAAPTRSPALARTALPPRPQVPVTEVEAWVVSTISEGLIDARMDQLTSSVVVTRAMQREFGSAQWLALQAKLAAWKTSVAGLLAVVEQRTGGGGGGGGGDHGGR